MDRGGRFGSLKALHYIRHDDSAGKLAPILAVCVVAYLEKVGQADSKREKAPLTEAEQQALVGTYVFGTGATERIVIAIKRFGLAMERTGTAQRNLGHLGGFEFFPIGAPAARVRFLQQGDKVAALEVHDPDLVCRATREA